MFNLFRKKLSYRCACCGNIYEGSPSLAYKKPTYYFDVPENEREARIRIDSDTCYIQAEDGNPDDDIYVIRATLDIPIHGVEEPFCWGVWVTQSRDNFRRYVETYNSDQSGISTFGWLAVTMSHYNRRNPGEGLESLACDVHWDENGQRPKIIVQESDHPLFHDQRNGITWDEAVRIAQAHMKTLH